MYYIFLFKKKELYYLFKCFWYLVVFILKIVFIFFLGLMVIFVVFYYVLWFFNIIIDIRNVCVFLVLMFLSFITLVIYWFIKEFKVRVFKFFIVFVFMFCINFYYYLE